VHDEVKIVGDHVPVGGEVALLVLLAGREGEAQAIWRRARRRRRPRAADRADLPAGAETIPVPAVGLEATDLDVDGVGVLSDRPGAPRLDQALKPLVGRHVPVD
jgi:hypothetical protein